MKLIILWLFIMVIGACNDQVNKKETSKIESGSDTTGRHSTVNTGDDGAGVLPLAPEADLYSIQVPGATISLQQWDSTLNLKQLLGEPIKQKTKKLDSNSDTHAGSYIKDMEFKGLRLKLFSPPQNGKHFWILEMILTGNKYKTTNDVTIGDQFEKVKKAYPMLKKFPGENENMYYVSDQSYEKSIEMQFEKDKLKSLRFYYMIP